RGAHSVTAPIENFCRETSHGRHEPKRPDHLRSSEGFAACAALDQKPELGPMAGPRLCLSAEIRKPLSSTLPFGVNRGEIGTVDIDMPRPSRAEPHGETFDGRRGHTAVTRAVHFEDRRERADREAMGLLQRDSPVRCRLPARDPQTVLENAKVL